MTLKSILIVDGNRVVAGLMKESLLTHLGEIEGGVDAIIIRSYFLAISAISAYQPDLISTGMVFPEKGGTPPRSDMGEQLIRDARKICPGTPVILFTGDTPRNFNHTGLPSDRIIHKGNPETYIAWVTKVRELLTAK